MRSKTLVWSYIRKIILIYTRLKTNSRRHIIRSNKVYIWFIFTRRYIY